MTSRTKGLHRKSAAPCVGQSEFEGKFWPLRSDSLVRFPWCLHIKPATWAGGPICLFMLPSLKNVGQGTVTESWLLFAFQMLVAGSRLPCFRTKVAGVVRKYQAQSAGFLWGLSLAHLKRVPSKSHRSTPLQTALC